MTAAAPTVEAAMSPPVTGVCQDEMLNAAIAKLVYFSLPAIPVVDARDHCIGLICDRDILRQLASGADAARTPIGSAATHSAALSASDDLERAARMIGESPHPLLPVVSEGKLVGLLTSLDIDAHHRLVTALGPAAEDVIDVVDEADIMFRGTRGAYVLAGASALGCVRRALQLVGKDSVGAILDFPSGYGRVMRVLQAAFPGASLTACDLDPQAVDFCASAFGARAVYSSSSFAEVEIDGEFDLIWCGSLFTHLDAPRWDELLALFARCLSPAGVLVFTTHGRHEPSALRAMAVSEQGIGQMLDGYDRTGFGHVNMPSALEEATYGLTITSREWVETRLAESDGLELVEYADKAWEPPYPRQDVVACRLRSPTG